MKTNTGCYLLLCAALTASAALPRLCAAGPLSETEVDRLCPPRPETAAAFKAGTYPPAARPYREAALMAFSYMASLPAMRTLVETGEPELLAKARALGDTITRVQTPEGRIPTFWTHDTLGQPLYDWLNCMGSSAGALLELDDACASAAPVEAGPGDNSSFATRHSPYGVCAHLHRVKSPAERADECRRIAAAGIRRVRFYLEWWRLQKTPGAPLDFSHYDAVVADCTAAGLTPLPILFDIPKWAEPVWEHLDAWSNFVGAVVAHYGDRFPEIEIWNEENLHTFWRHDPSPANYAAALRAAYGAAKAANPRVRVLFGGTAGVPLPFIEGGASCFDAMNVHPYSHPRQPEGSLDAQLEALRALMAKYGDGGKPIVITELGWPTHDASLGAVNVALAGLKIARPDQKTWRTVFAATQPGADGGLPTEVAEAIAEALPPGSTCEACFGARLRERLAAGDVDAVIYPFDETYPADTADAVLAFVDAGGVLVDLGGMPAWFAVREPAPGSFVTDRSGDGTGTAAFRKALGIDVSAWWLDPALTNACVKADPTAAALAAGFKGDPAGEDADRFQTPRLLAPGDEFVPLLVAKDALGRDAVAASVIRRGGGRRGSVIISGLRPRGAAGTNTEDNQARYVTRSLAIAFAEGVESYFWYEFRGRETDPHYSEHHFGLTHRDFSPKPALAAYTAFIEMRPAGSVQTPGPWHDGWGGLSFSQWTRPDGTPAGVIWKTGGPARVALRFDGGDVRFRDIFGVPAGPRCDASGAVELTVSESPIYFEGGALSPMG